MMIACRDCIHVQGTQCHHPKSFAELPDYYNGTTYTAPHSLTAMRALGSCGPEAVLFTEKLPEETS